MRLRRVIAVAVAPIAVLGATAFVFGTSWASFSARTTAPGQSFSSATVSLDLGTTTVPFATSTLTPGSPVQYTCVAVTYTGSVPADLAFYLTDYSALNGTNSGANLEDDMTMTVTRTPGDATSTCATWTSPYTVFATASPKDLSTRNGWTNANRITSVAPGTTVTYRVAYQLPDLSTSGGTNDGDLSDAVGVKLTWEARSLS